MKKIIPFIVAFASVFVCSLLVFTSLDNKTADFFQRFLPKTEEKQNVIMINVDDASVDNIGTWPFSREVYAKMLTTLKEFNTESVVFDLSFLDKSTARVDEEYVNSKLPEYIEDYFKKLDESIIETLSQDLSNDDEKENAAYSLLDITHSTKNEINTSIAYVIKSQDAELADAFKFFENTYLTLTFGNEFVLDGEEKNFVEENIKIENIKNDNDTKTKQFTGMIPAILEFLSKAKKAGFVNADPDTDGYLRRVNLILKYNGNYYGQLVFVPLLEHFGNPEIEVSKKYITLKNARIDENTFKDIKIPRSEDGTILVKYPKHVDYVDYNAVSLWDIYRLSLLEESLVNNLKQMDEYGFFGDWFYEDALPLEAYNGAEYLIGELNASGEIPEDEITYENYYSYKNMFLESLDVLFAGEYQEYLCSTVIDDSETYDFVNESFAVTNEIFKEYITSRNEIAEKVNNAICIIGTTATSTTDFGLTQYEEHFPNPGLHYTIANQILSEDFVDDSPVWISIIIALVLCLVYVIISQKTKGTGHKLIAGVIILVLSAGALLLFFVATRIYIGTVIPVLSVFLLFVVDTIINLLTQSKEKKFITNAFGQCLSKEVVNEIIKNPSSMKLGGDSRTMTAIFTDIQKFSSFSELMNAEELVALLNFYLTKMSDLVMYERGTVDKYEGDAIIAFMGAPLSMEEHAKQACNAAIQMKKAEAEMNKYILEVVANGKPEDMSDELFSAFNKMVKNKKTLFTRIGINSGEMVAGFMGSESKKNYTMMGNNVNLASRIEGVNKQYSTGGIMITESTRELLDDNFIVRKLDRVQVVNVETPIRLYELLDYKSSETASLEKYVENWDKTMAIFEKGEYETALSYFKKMSEIKPDDNVAKYYISLLEKFFVKGKFPTAQDDFGVAYNDTNPENMKSEWLGTKYEIKGTFKLLQK